jgi:hypothetical protein
MRSFERKAAMKRVDRARMTCAWAWLFGIAASGGCAGPASHARVEVPRTPAVQREILNAFDCPDVPVHTEEDEQAEREWRFAALKLELPADHVRFVNYVAEHESWIFAARGDACGTATDKSGCASELDRLMVAGGAKEQVFAITIAGDELKLYEGRAVLPLLGPIDNVDKAWTALMIAKGASTYLCQMPEWAGWRETADGYEFAWAWTDKICRPVQRLQAIDHVDRAGNVSRLRLHVVEHEADACIVANPASRARDRASAAENATGSEAPKKRYSNVR